MPQRNQKDSDLAVITYAKHLCAYVMQATQKSPKAFRFSYVAKLQNFSLEVVENLFRANEVFVVMGDTRAIAKRSEYQHAASASLKLLIYMAEMATGQGCLTMKQYEQISKQGVIVGRMIGTWIASDDKRFAGATL